jgi:hypothetical protein
MAFTKGFTMSHSLHWLLAAAATLTTAAAQALPLGPLNPPGPTNRTAPSVSSGEGCSQTRGGWSCSSSPAPACLFAKTKGGLSCLPWKDLVAEKSQI